VADREHAVMGSPEGRANASVGPALPAATPVPFVAHRRTLAPRPPAAGPAHRAQPPAGVPGQAVVPVGDLRIDQLIDERK
jgi:hypothetical protein